MTIQDILRHILDADMTPEELDAFWRENKMNGEEAAAYIQRQREFFVTLTLEFIILSDGFWERQDDSAPWDIDRTFRDLTAMRHKIHHMESFLAKMLETEAWLT